MTGWSRHYRRALGVEHSGRIGGQFERGEHDAVNMIPTGVRYEDSGRVVAAAGSSLPAQVGGVSFTSSAFATDTMTVGDRVTISAGVRFDHSRAISQDLRALDRMVREIDEMLIGHGTMDTWNMWSPRLGLTAKLTGAAARYSGRDTGDSSRAC